MDWFALFVKVKPPDPAVSIPLPEIRPLPILIEEFVRLKEPMFRVPAARFSAPLVEPAEAEPPTITVELEAVMPRPVKVFVPERVSCPALVLELITVRLPELFVVPSAMFTPIELVKPLTSKTPPLVPIETASVLLPVTVLVAIKLAPMLDIACMTPPLDQVSVLATPLTALLEL